MAYLRNSYLNFNTATFMLQKNRFLHFDITRSVAVDVGVTVIYGIVLTLQVWLFVRWQKRPALEPRSKRRADRRPKPSARRSAGAPAPAPREARLRVRPPRHDDGGELMARN